MAFVLFWSLGIFFAGRNSAKKAENTQFITQVDTLFVYDTITLEKPVYLTRAQTKTEYIPVRDTVRFRDTLYLSLPIEKRVYQDSLYRAEVSGYMPSLDRIDIYQQTRTITQSVPVAQVERKRWGIGLQAGYGVSARQGVLYLTPYVGVGLSYDLIRW